MKKNKFKPENIMKLSTSVRRTREAAKSLKIGTNGLEIEAKEDCTTADAKGITSFLQAFHVYTQILVFLAAPGNKLQLQLALGKHAEHLMMLWEMYTWDSMGCSMHAEDSVTITARKVSSHFQSRNHGSWKFRPTSNFAICDNLGSWKSHLTSYLAICHNHG